MRQQHDAQWGSSIAVGAFAGHDFAGYDFSAVPDASRQFAAQSAYHAANDSHRRQRINAKPLTEDELLTTRQRAKLGENARDMVRNYAVAAWAVRCHLNYICAHRPSFTTADDGFNRDAEAWIVEQMKPVNFDETERFSGKRFIRLLEAQRVTVGDVLVVRLPTKRLQAIEYDRIFTPEKVNPSDRWANGVRVNKSLKHLGYAVHERLPGGTFQFEREVPAEAGFLFGYFDRFEQTRGVSPLAPGLTQLRDVAEAQLYALAKAKISQFFALVVKRANDDEDDTGSVDVDFNGGPVQVDLNLQDEASFLESATPSTQFQDFTKTVLQMALRALDIPISFFNEAETNFFGSRGAWIHYHNAAEDKREGVRELLTWWAHWRLLRGILDGEFVLPRSLTVADVLRSLEWIASAGAWWSPLQELNGQLLAIAGGLDNPQRICRESGGDYFRNIDAISTALDYAREKRVPITWLPNLGPAAMAPPDANSNSGGK